MKMYKKIPLFLSVFPFMLFAQNQANYTYQSNSERSFRVSDNYLSKHDIVYLSPTQLEVEGFPMGNGNIGGMLWNTDEGIEIQIQKNDLWTVSSPHIPIDQEGGVSTMKHAARIKVDFGKPVYSWIHLKQYEGRLSLKKSETQISAQTAYSKTKVNSWVAVGKNLWIIECENLPGAIAEKIPPISTITLERLGSRAFSRWYAGDFSSDPQMGVDAPHIELKDKVILLTEQKDSIDFTVGLRILGGDVVLKPKNDFSAVAQTSATKFYVLISVISRNDYQHPAQEALRLLNAYDVKQLNRLKEEKEQWFENFWSNSFLKIGNDYLENLYYLRRYLMAAGSQGKYPVAFNGGLWRWNRDVFNWVTPHHWNTQQQYWGLCVQNDAELMKPYLRTYFAMLPQATALAQEKGATNQAILISEGHEFSGRQILKDRPDMDKNFTPASQIAFQFWDYYDYTQNQEFLKDTAYVFMKKAAQFYLEKLHWDAKEKKYSLQSSLYESADIDEAKNVISDRDCVESLFTKCIKAAKILGIDRDKVKLWQHVLDHLWERIYMDDPQYGELLSPVEQYNTTARYTPFNWASGGSPVFPNTVIGIDQKDTRLGRAVKNMVKAHTEVNAHYPTPIIAARMAMGNEALTYIINGVKLHQMYPNGTMTNVTGYPNNIYNLQSIHDLLDGKYKIRSRDFFQAGMEPMSEYAATINEMLLQSNESKIRVFPAIPDAWRDSVMAFTLRARGAFVVSALWKNQEVTQLDVRSEAGILCQIQNPWTDRNIQVISEGKSIKYSQNTEGVIRFATQKNRTYKILRKQKMNTEMISFEAQKNTKAKKLGDRTLGLESGMNN